MPVQPNQIKIALPTPTVEVNKLTTFAMSIDVSGLQPKADETIQLTPALSSHAGKSFRISRLDLLIPSGVAQGTDTRIVIAKQSDDSAIMTVANAANTNAWDAKNLQFEDDAVATNAGKQLLHRLLTERWYVGLFFDTAKAAAIGSNKVIDLYMEYSAS